MNHFDMKLLKHYEISNCLVTNDVNLQLSPAYCFCVTLFKQYL